MSTITATAHLIPTRRVAVAAPAVRLTRRGRVVLVLAFLALAAIAMVALSGIATATRDSGQPEPVRYVEVGAGDTLYGIAGEVAEPGKIREMVAHIRSLNSLPSAELQVGQRLAVPLG